MWQIITKAMNDLLASVNGFCEDIDLYIENEQIWEDTN
jgi:hypothetical protein